MGHNLTSKQRKVISMLASGISVTDISKQLKLRRQTIWNWKQNPRFCMELERAVSVVREGFHHRLLQLVDSSISQVKQSMNDEKDDTKRTKVALNILKLVGIER